MGDELRGESLVRLNVRFQSETELKKFQDLLYEKSGQGISFTGLLEAMASEVTIVTAIHNIKSNKGSKTAGVDGAKMDRYLQMPKDELTQLIQSKFMDYKPTGPAGLHSQKQWQTAAAGYPHCIRPNHSGMRENYFRANLRSEVLSA